MRGYRTRQMDSSPGKVTTVTSTRLPRAAEDLSRARCSYSNNREACDKNGGHGQRLRDYRTTRLRVLGVVGVIVPVFGAGNLDFERDEIRAVYCVHRDRFAPGIETV